MIKTVKELAEHINGQIIGDETLKISGAATLSEAGEGDVTFLANMKYEKELQSTAASVVVVGETVESKGLTLIRCKDPYYSFMQVVVLLHGHREHEPVGISPKSSVSDSAKIGKNADIHDFTTISSNAVIGDNTTIYPNCTIGPGTRIGNDCIIFPNVTVYDGCTIGDRVTIHSGSIIGQDGFGYATHDGVHHKIPQIGGVIIEDDVEIGANCSIDRATLGNTVIGHGTKMSNQVAIGHNTTVGHDSLLVAQTGIAGSVHVGHHCIFGGQAGVVGHITIGNGVRVSAQAGVTNNLEDGQIVAGSPALPITQAKRAMMVMKDLPELRKKIRELDKTLRHFTKDNHLDT
ncbi:MAG: UDP-3-O-(3-hydroxymyristoyl)glucosamine N-acyltransferase [Phycisphaerae bacterium]|nr:UDP-3-O-(3-hydroxymyristoyl)glucosamine N-acyltransferase [Phycisphaerae bacterium]